MTDLNKREAGIQEITLKLFNVPLAGTNARGERLELEQNMAAMLQTNKFSYADIENYFIQWGYQVPMIREVFKHITGLEPERFNSANYLFDMPGCIPGFNYGWGEGKGKYKYVFVITYKLGFGVFGQIDDLKRELLAYTLDLDEAFEVLNKNGKNIKTCKQVIDIPPTDVSKNFSKPYLCTDEPAVQHLINKGRTASLVKAVTSQDLQPHEVRAALRTAYDNKEITAEEHKALYNIYLKRLAEEQDDKSDITKELEKQSLEDAKVETPKEAFDTMKQDKTVDFDLNNVASCIKKIGEYLDEALSDIYEKAMVIPRNLTYSKKDSDGSAIEKTPEVAGQNPKQYFNKTALFNVVLGVTLNEKSDLGEQPVLAVFQVDDKGNVTTDGQFKGVDNELYALNLSGIETYLDKIAGLDEKPVVKE
jgi:hypothetical protein